MKHTSTFVAGLAVAASVVCLFTPPATAQDDADAKQIRAADEQLVKAFNAGKADDLAALFLPKGELIDEQGNAYQGQAELKDLFAKYFGKFPGATLALEIESIRVVGPVAIEEGTRHMATKDSAAKAEVRYITVRAKTAAGWPIASIREFGADPIPEPSERLQALAWLVGDWVNESSDAAVKISYRWAEDKNFLLGDFHITRGGTVAMKSTQRIGWDPLAGKVRSWMFDSDGGYADGNWTQVGDTWVIKSSAVMPDGQTGSATVTITPKDKDHYSMKGTDRIVGDERDADFEVAVAKRPPAPGK